VTQHSSVTQQPAPSESDVVGYLAELSNWGRWGSGDQLGTLNLISRQTSRSSALLVREGRTVSCSGPHALISVIAGTAHCLGEPIRRIAGEDLAGMRVTVVEQRLQYSPLEEPILPDLAYRVMVEADEE
jgi:hypothetical protein